MANGVPDPSNLTDPSKVASDLEPEIVDGPLGLPIVKPKGAPTPDGGDLSAPGGMDDLY